MEYMIFQFHHNFKKVYLWCHINVMRWDGNEMPASTHMGATVNEVYEHPTTSELL